MMYRLYNDGYEGFGPSNMMGFWGGGIIMIAFWVLLVVFIVWIVREVSGKNSRSNSNALEILKERYAKGEINKEEFETKKKDLMN